MVPGIWCEWLTTFALFPVDAVRGCELLLVFIQSFAQDIFTALVKGP